MSGTSSPPVAVTVLREAVRRAVEASSIRPVAGAIGVSHGAVVKFLAGAKPQAATMRKLTAWYVRHSIGSHMDRDAAEAALAVLLNGYPPNQRATVREGILDVLRKGHQAAGTEPPEWLK